MSDVSNFPLDIFSQNASINRLYTQLTLAFDIQGDPQQRCHTIIQLLSKGLSRLTTSFPWIGGKVVEHEGEYQIIALQDDHQMIVTHLEGQTWPYTWEQLCEADFPFSMMHEETVAPRPTMATEEERAAGLPVFLVRANFAGRGLLMTVQGQHGAMDMAGLAQVMRLFAKATRGEDFTSEELQIGNMSRTNMITLLTDSEYELAIQERNSYRAGKTGADRPTIHGPGPLTWAYLSFNSTTLSRLKSEANDMVPQGSFVSTDDVLSAYIWRLLIIVRRSRYGEDESLSTILYRNVDVRKALGIESTYPGLLVHVTTTEYSIQELVDSHTGTIALRLREALSSVGLAQEAKIAATAMSRGKTMFTGPAKRHALDITLSSWAKESCYDLNFGFSYPVAVRRPAFETDGGREDVVYFLPKAPDGTILVAVCLGEKDTRRLRQEIEDQDGSIKFIG